MENTNEDIDLKIIHNQDDFKEGENYILTMKDQPLLADGDLNEEDEEMVNVQLNEAYKTQIYLKNKAKVTQGETGIYDANNFDQHGELKKRALLDKYDIEEEEKEGMLLNIKNNKIKKKSKALKNISTFDNGDKNLMVTKKIFRSDFMIEDESINLGGSKKFKNKKRRNLKKSRKLQETMKELLGEEVDGEDDLKTREERINDLRQHEIRAQEVQDGKRKNYEKAVLKANLQTNKIHNPDLEEDEDYELLQKSIENQRRVRENKSTENMGNKRTKRHEEALFSLLKEAEEEEENSKEKKDNVFIMPATRERTKSRFSKSYNL